jgi:hypothetical protein
MFWPTQPINADTVQSQEIAALRARIKKLEGALRRIANCETWVYGELVDIARSALTGKE